MSSLVTASGSEIDPNISVQAPREQVVSMDSLSHNSEATINQTI